MHDLTRMAEVYLVIILQAISVCQAGGLKWLRLSSTFGKNSRTIGAIDLEVQQWIQEGSVGS